jgi:hypothetical protein
MHGMTVGQRIVELLVIAAAVMTVQALLCRLQRRNASIRDGWRYLTPGPMVWTGLVLSIGLTGLLSYVYLFVGSARPDAEFQMKMLLGLTVSFNLVTILIAYSTVVEEVRWNETEIQRRTWLFSRRAMTWPQLAAFSIEMSGYWWIRSYHGPKIRFSPYSNGFDQLVRKIADNLPTDLPPAEAELIGQVVRVQSC